MKTLLSLIIAVGLGACSRAPHQPTLSPKEQQTLIVEGRNLLVKHHENTIFEIPDSEWPKSVLALHPLELRRYGGGLGIVLWKWVSKEAGFMVTDPGFTPSDASNATYEKISDGLFWYTISG